MPLILVTCLLFGKQLVSQYAVFQKLTFGGHHLFKLRHSAEVRFQTFSGQYIFDLVGDARLLVFGVGVVVDNATVVANIEPKLLGRCEGRLRRRFASRRL